MWLKIGFYIKKNHLFIFIFGCPGSLLLCMGLSPTAGRAGPTLAAVRGFLIAGTSLAVVCGLQGEGFSSCGPRA